MPSTYPATLDAFSTARADATVSATTHKDDHNNANDAVNKIEIELGINPRGLYAATVRERFEISAYKMQSCRLATATGTNVAGTYANGTAGVGATKAVTGVSLTIDGSAVANGDRVLLKDQTTAFENGIYTVTGVGTSVLLTRAIDADTATKIADCKVLVDIGSTNADTEWYSSATAPTMGTTALYFRRSTPIYGHGNSRSLWTPGTTQSIMETLPRACVGGTMAWVVTTSTQYMFGGIVCPAGRVVSNVNFIATVAGAAPTISWFAVARQSDRLTMAHTANSTTAPTINVLTTRALTAPWTPIYDTPVWIIASYAVATTPPTLLSSGTSAAATNLLAPAMSATNATVPTTTVPTDGTTVIGAATAGFSNVPYFFLT